MQYFILGNIQRSQSLKDIRTKKREKPERPGHKSLISLNTIREDSSGKGSSEKVTKEENNEVRQNCYACFSQMFAKSVKLFYNPS